MKSNLFFLFTFITCWLLSSQTFGQVDSCDASKVSGPNLVVNGDFEDGDTGFTTGIGCSWNDPACTCHNNTYSELNQYYVGGSPSEASPCGGSFQPTWSDSPHSGNSFLMVDGDGDNVPIVWEQDIVVQDSSYYYFETWITTLGNAPDLTKLADLRFYIDGVEMTENINAPSTTNTWVNYTQLWYSGNTSGTITIQIIDVQPISAGENGDDFGLDDITFALGCPPDSYVEQPELGPDLTFCGTDETSFTLDPNVTLNVGQSLTWSTGSVDAGKDSITVYTGGTYYVCINQAGSCTKIDSVYIQEDFTEELGNDIELCDPASMTLTADLDGPGVTYQWYQDDVLLPLGTSKDLYINESGEYKVVVTDDICGSETDSVNVTLDSNMPTAQNVDFCLTSNPDTTIRFSVDPVGTEYSWYDVSSGGTALSSGAEYHDLSGVTTGDTLYAENTTLYAQPSVGPTVGDANFGYGNNANFTRIFDAETDLVITSVVMQTGVDYYGNNICSGKSVPGTLSDAFTVTLRQGGSDIATSDPIQLPCGGLVSFVAQPGTPTTVNLNFSVPANTGYRLVVDDTRSGNLYIKSGSDDPDHIITDVININSKTGYSGAFFDWAIEVPTSCGRVPVIARDICVLPVEFMSVKAINTNSGVEIYWGTASEKDNSHFEIERLSSGDWLSVGRVEGSGNSKDVVFYDFLDENAPNGIVYYRIKQVDFDGMYDYSDVVTVDNRSFSTKLWPNPSKGSATLVISSADYSKGFVQVHDTKGVLIEQFEAQVNQSISIGDNYETGLYIISIWNGSHLEKLKFIKN